MSNILLDLLEVQIQLSSATELFENEKQKTTHNHLCKWFVNSEKFSYKEFL